MIPPASPTSTVGVGVAEDAVDVGDEPRLVGGHCLTCDTTSHPAPAQCPTCWSPLVPRTLSGTGSLYSYSVVHIAPQGWHAPYTVGYVDLPEDVRVFAHLTETDEARLHPDMPVRLLLHRAAGGFTAEWTPIDPKEDSRA